MANTLMLVNPRRRRRKTRAKKKRVAKRRAARPVSRRRKTRRKRARNPIGAYLGNKKRRSRRYGRNPLRLGFNQKSITTTATTALGGATGALALDALFGWLGKANDQGKSILPDSFKQSPMLLKGLKAGAAIGLGVLVNKYVMKGRKFGNDYLGTEMANGALTVLLYEMGKEKVKEAFPNMALGEYIHLDNGLSGLGYYNPGMPLDGLNEFLPGDFAQFEQGGMNGLANSFDLNSFDMDSGFDL